MSDLTIANIGSIFGKMRSSFWNTKLISNSLGLDIDTYYVRWHDAVKKDYKFPEKKNKVAFRFFSPYVDDEMNEFIEENYGQTHLTPGEKYAEGFCSMIDTVQERIEAQVNDFVYVNSPEAIKNLRDKREMSRILHKNNIPHPEIIENPDVETIINEIDKGKTICVKPIGGSCGRGVTRLRKINNGNNGYQLTTTWKSSDDFSEEKKSHTEELTKDNFEIFIKNYIEFGGLFQEWIDNYRGEWDGKKYSFDMREIVLYPDIYETAVTEIIRKAPPDEITTNISNGNSPAGYLFAKNNLGDDGIEKTRKLAIDAAKSFENLNF